MTNNRPATADRSGKSGNRPAPGSRAVKLVGVASAALVAAGLTIGIGDPYLATAAARPAPSASSAGAVPGSPVNRSMSRGTRREGDGYRTARPQAQAALPARMPAGAPTGAAGAKPVEPPVAATPPTTDRGGSPAVSQPVPTRTPTPTPPKPAQPTPARSAPAPQPSPAAPPRQASAPITDPAQSRQASTDFYSNCFGSSYNQSACDQSALSNIDQALAGEGRGRLSLPSNYSGLSIAAQLIAVANAERSVRGLPAMAENGSLDARAYQGAQSGTDPTGPSGYAWGSNLATGYPTALAADYVWMYDDGPNSPNVDCRSAGASGCWGHRHNILIQGGGQAGAAIYDNGGTPNLTELFVVNY